MAYCLSHRHTTLRCLERGFVYTSLLLRFHQTNCKDPRDRVFAFLGILPSVEREHLLKHFPDYTLTFEGVANITLAHVQAHFGQRYFSRIANTPSYNGRKGMLQDPQDITNHRFLKASGAELAEAFRYFRLFPSIANEPGFARRIPAIVVLTLLMI